MPRGLWGQIDAGSHRRVDGIRSDRHPPAFFAGQPAAREAGRFELGKNRTAGVTAGDSHQQRKVWSLGEGVVAATKAEQQNRARMI